MHWLSIAAVHCQRVSELNERYNSCRAKTAESVAAAVKRKEDVSPSVDVFFTFQHQFFQPCMNEHLNVVVLTDDTCHLNLE